jgi:formate hydrogenlyase subunit 6/NADH:ubiquinone oxidoreductase subunit I
MVESRCGSIGWLNLVREHRGGEETGSSPTSPLSPKFGRAFSAKQDASCVWAASCACVEPTNALTISQKQKHQQLPI